MGIYPERLPALTKPPPAFDERVPPSLGLLMPGVSDTFGTDAEFPAALDDRSCHDGRSQS